MKIKIHSGFRAAQKSIDAAPPGRFADPALPPQGARRGGPSVAAPAKKRGPLFGGKQAPPFPKKSRRTDGWNDA